MAIQYMENLPQRKASKYAVVDIEDLLLDVNNPRFASSSLFSRENEIGQNEIINYLVEFGGACQLAQEVEYHNGLFGEDIMSGCVSGGKVIVLEGNRRLAACKLLLDNTLLNERLTGLFPLPTLSEKTRANIQKIMMLIYDDSADAQTYIASKHTQPNIKKWTTIEQYNYYYSQLTKGKTSKEISSTVGVDASEIEKRAKDYSLFYAIFTATKKNHPSLQVEAATILPVASAFMPKLFGGNKKYALQGVEYNRDNLSYAPLPAQKELYDEILSLIGDAFFVRPEAKKKSEKEERETNDRFRISSDEIKGANKVNMLIDEDVRIPGLKQLILKFRGEEQNDIKSHSADSSDASTAHADAGNQYQPSAENPNGGESSPGASNKTSGSFAGRESPASFSAKEKQVRFFADFKYEHLEPTREEHKGLIAVAKEIKALSCADNYTGYYKFPLAASFLLRSLIEQTLLCQLKGTTLYTRLNHNTAKATPELDKMVNEVLKACQNNNYQQINIDKNLGSDFCACFNGSGTKRQLDKIIHSPAECQPNKEFLDSIANGGLKSLLQKFVNTFT